jgi:hypothetical protein
VPQIKQKHPTQSRKGNPKGAKTEQKLTAKACQPQADAKDATEEVHPQISPITQIENGRGIATKERTDRRVVSLRSLHC